MTKCDTCRSKRTAAGQAYTKYRCAHCLQAKTHHHTNTPTICSDCSKETKRCEQCLNHLEEPTCQCGKQADMCTCVYPTIPKNNARLLPARIVRQLRTKKFGKIVEADCTYCSKTFLDEEQEAQGTVASFVFGYGSKNNGYEYELPVCDDCFNKHLRKHCLERKPGGTI